MKQQAFIENRKERWARFERMLSYRGRRERRREAESFTELYLALCQDLTAARANNYSPTLISRLNRLVHSGYRVLYKARSFSVRRIVRFWRIDFPRTVRDNINAVFLTAVLFYGLGLFSYLLVRSYPQAAYIIAGEDTLVSLERMYDPDGERLHHQRDENTDAGMFAFYIYNNVSIGFRIFAGGVFFGIGSLLILIFNGVFFGTVWAHLIHMGYQSTFLSFVIGHGFIELNAFVLCGVAGLKMGWALTAPGNLSRRDALKQAADRALPLVYGGAGMLFVAAVIEAFWSARPLSFEIKAAFAVTAAVLTILYFLLSGRRCDAE